MDLNTTPVFVEFAIVLSVAAIILLIIWDRRQSRTSLTVTLADAQKGVRGTEISAIEGTDRNLTLFVYLTNRNDLLVRVLSKQGTVIEAADPRWQNMVAVRSQVFEVAPKSVGEFRMHAICLDAWKLPPGSGGEGNYRVGEITKNRDIIKLLRTAREMEEQIAPKIISVAGNQFRAKPMSEELVAVAKCCTYTQARRGTYLARIQDTVVQCALWQITDRLSFDQYAQVISAPASARGIGGLVAQVRVSNILLGKAGLSPTAVV
jgi:hypothetical protein